MAKDIAARKDDTAAKAKAAAELKEVPPLATMAAEIKDEKYDGKQGRGGCSGAL